MNQPNQPNTDNPLVQIDGKEYHFQDLPDNVKELIMLHNKWHNELIILKSEGMKLEAAIRMIAQDIGGMMPKSAKKDKELETFHEYDTLRPPPSMADGNG